MIHMQGQRDINGHKQGKCTDEQSDLVGQSVQRPGQPVHGGAEGEVGVGQRAAHQVAGVGADVAALVVTAAGVRTQEPSVLATPPPANQSALHHSSLMSLRLQHCHLPTIVRRSEGVV